MHVYLRTSLDLAFSSLAVALFVHYLRWKRSVAELPLPPGPRRLPLVHNLFDLPKGFEAAHWAKHKDRYGTISHSLKITILLTEITVLRAHQLCLRFWINIYHRERREDCL